MLTDSVCHNFAILCHGIHFHFLGVLDELAHHYRMLFRYIGSQFQETFQFFLIRTYIHGGSTQHIRRANQYREAHFVNKGINVFHGSQCTPFGLVYSDTVKHGREFITVFGIVNALGTCSEDVNSLSVQAESKIIRYLTTGGNDDSMRIFQFENIHHTLESQLVKVQTVAHIIVGRNRFGIIINHDTAVTLLTDSLQSLHATPVKFHRRTDAVSTRTQYHDGFMVA